MGRWGSQAPRAARRLCWQAKLPAQPSPRRPEALPDDENNRHDQQLAGRPGLPTPSFPNHTPNPPPPPPPAARLAAHPWTAPPPAPHTSRGSPCRSRACRGRRGRRRLRRRGAGAGSCREPQRQSWQPSASPSWSPLHPARTTHTHTHTHTPHPPRPLRNFSKLSQSWLVRQKMRHWSMAKASITRCAGEEAGGEGAGRQGPHATRQETGVLVSQRRPGSKHAPHARPRPHPTPLQAPPAGIAASVASPPRSSSPGCPGWGLRGRREGRWGQRGGTHAGGLGGGCRAPQGGRVQPTTDPQVGIPGQASSGPPTPAVTPPTSRTPVMSNTWQPSVYTAGLDCSQERSSRGSQGTST